MCDKPDNAPGGRYPAEKKPASIIIEPAPAGREESECPQLTYHYHVVCSTRNRELWLGVEWRESLHAYIGGIVRDLKGVPIIVGGVADHVHALLGLKATHAVADVVREMKRGSCQWMHDERRRAAFAWQEGYGGFTVSPTHVEAVRKYIANQAEHHRNRTFKEEYVELLKAAGIEYDETYLW